MESEGHASDEGQASDVEGQLTDVEKQSTEPRVLEGQETDAEGQTTDIEGQTTDVEGQSTDTEGNVTVEGKGRRSREERYLCHFEGCLASFNRIYRLQRHVRTHTGEKPYICDVSGCSRAFTCASYLKKHMSRPHEGVSGMSTDEKKPDRKRKRYQCENCEKEYKTKFELKIHVANHSEEKPFKCEKCEKGFALRSRLRRHLKVHEKYPCTWEGCTHEAEKWSLLRKHIQQHRKEVAHRCETCSKVFSNNYNLRLHEASHNGEVAAKCTFDGCAASFSKKANLKLHVKAVHEKQKFNCAVEGCSQVFAYKGSLQRHLKNHDKPRVYIPNSQRVFKRKTCFAEQLSGFEPTDSERSLLLDADKHFRKTGLDCIVDLPISSTVG